MKNVNFSFNRKTEQITINSKLCEIYKKKFKTLSKNRYVLKCFNLSFLLLKRTIAYFFKMILKNKKVATK